jgi:hypothetical protein
MPEGKLSKKLQDSTIQMRTLPLSALRLSRILSREFTVYNDLPHPAPTYIGPNFAWRTANGSGNNVALPSMGQAGTPYSRSVQQYHAIPQDTLPDPGLVFDTLLKRDGVRHTSMYLDITCQFFPSSCLIPLVFPA